MKRILCFLIALLTVTFSLRAQQYVSTEPANRNVILEEFTGRNCGYCPLGHHAFADLIASHPGRVWAANIHCTSLSPTSYPNLNIPKGHQIANGFSFDGIPTAVANRHSGSGQGFSEGSNPAWVNLVNNKLSEAAECNVAGMVVLNPGTRLATITVEVYYTGNSAYDQNYLTVAMTQDSILGSQADYGNYNPGQWIGNQYVHMHTLRDIISESIWGDPISPTTQGTLITRTYIYQVPETIGSPSGVAVDLENIHFLAWVGERYQGTATRPILNACQLGLEYGADEAIAPFFKSVSQSPEITCSHTKTINANIINGGYENLTSMTMTVELEGETTTYNWEGDLGQFETDTVTIPVEVPFGAHEATLHITSANGEPYEMERTISLNCIEWSDYVMSGSEETMTLELMQDKYGNHIRWEVASPDGTVLASGGPYTILMGDAPTLLHLEHFTIPANDCVRFTITDAGGNGICCTNGQGYFIVRDSNNQIVYGDQNDGAFGSSATILFSTHQINASVGETSVELVDENTANFISSLSYDGYPEEVGFDYRKVTNSTVYSVQGIINEFKTIFATVSDLDDSSIYMVKAYAIVDGTKIYGPETTFNTPLGVNEFIQTLKVYPNPASRQLNIEGEGMVSIEVFNAIGQRVMIQDVNGGHVKLNTGSLDNGMYFVRIHVTDGTTVNRSFSVAR